MDNPLADNQELTLGLGCSSVAEHLIALHARGSRFIPTPTQGGLIIGGFWILPNPSFPAYAISCNSVSSRERFSVLGGFNRHGRDCLGVPDTSALQSSV